MEDLIAGLSTAWDGLCFVIIFYNEMWPPENWTAFDVNGFWRNSTSRNVKTLKLKRKTQQEKTIVLGG